MLVIKVDGEEYLEVPLLGNVEVFIDDKLVWDNIKVTQNRDDFQRGDKLVIIHTSYQDFKLANGINNTVKKVYNNILAEKGEVVTFESYGVKTSCPTESRWIRTKEYADCGIADILVRKLI